MSHKDSWGGEEETKTTFRRTSYSEASWLCREGDSLTRRIHDNTP